MAGFYLHVYWIKTIKKLPNSAKCLIWSWIFLLITQQKSRQRFVNCLYNEIITDGKICLSRNICSIQGPLEKQKLFGVLSSLCRKTLNVKK